MSKQNVFLSNIRNLSPLREILAARPLQEQAQIVTVIFEGDRVGLLDLSYPRATVWAKMIDYLQKNNRPVYVEIDPDTNVITKLYIPDAARVWQINSQGEEVVYVVFHTSSARHYLRRSHPDYQKMLDALQAALDTDSLILVTSTHNDFEIIDVRPLPSSFGTEEPPAPPAPQVPDPSVEWDRALELFNMMKAQSCVPCSAVDPCIPFRYPYDGCWIRAHLMCYLMRGEGETPEKIWIDHSSGHSLLALSSNVPECQVVWGWHVAPTLMVKQASGPDIKMVIDPSLCDKPVTFEEWKSLQGDLSATLTSSSWDKYGHSGGTATQAQANNDMEEYRLKLDELCSDYGTSPYVCPIVKNSFFIVDRSTISKDEIDAMLSIGSPAVIEATFFVVVDGFTPADLGITNSTLVGIPNIKPILTISPAVSQMTLEVMPNIGLEDPVHLIRRQRITWKYKSSFTGTSGFVSELQELNLSASISTVSASAKIFLVTQPNPYEIDGETAWLSTDLRVFQIKAGESRFGNTMSTDASDFISTVVNNLNNGTTGGQTFESISVDQQTSKLELSQSVGGIQVYNFAIAKVRYRALSVSAQGVRVFFRLFPASSTSLEYNQATTYRRAIQGGAVKPLLGIIGGEVVTIPCFAAARVDSSSTAMTEQADPANVQTIPANAVGNEVIRYFGCWLDINQTQPQFPINPVPTDGPYPAMNRKTIQELIRNQHQCLVAEIAFDPAPIPNGASPSTSDKLAQRNLAIVESANPGNLASHRIPHTFEIRPTQSKRGDDELPDELMIDWGNTPVGSSATLYLPSVDTNNILKLAVKVYRSHTLIRIDAHTLQCETGGITYIPIPQSEGANYVGMMSVDLPETVKKGQVFTIVVRQVTSAVRGHTTLTHESIAAISPARDRRILGSFQITIPVRVKEEMLVREERLLSNLRWIESAIPANNRWALVFGKYVMAIAERVDALGGDSEKVGASPAGEWKEAYRRCLFFTIATILLIVILLVGIGASGSGLMTTIDILIFALLTGMVYFWLNKCRPKMCKLLRTLIAGAGIGTLILAVLALLGLPTPQLIATFVTGAGITAVAAIVGWVKHCF
jgi:hypothetical protein